MESHRTTAPFGRRALTLGDVAANVASNARAKSKAANKWSVFQNIRVAKDLIGLSGHSLNVLEALLSFHPETVLTGDELIVFPSNVQLCLRAGIAEPTLRRHLSALVGRGLIQRRDSPNGKRYARRGLGGQIEKAFGFDISPLVAGAENFAELAKQTQVDQATLRNVKECISLCRRDIQKMILLGIEEGIEGDWPAIKTVFRSIIEDLPRSAKLAELEPPARALTRLANEIDNLLETHVNLQKKNGNDDHGERHIQSSKPEIHIELEAGRVKEESEGSGPSVEAPRRQGMLPLKTVLGACPDISSYARFGVANWRDFLATVSAVMPMLRISDSAWKEACEAMGETDAAIAVAAILQRGTKISSAGGYLRDLTRRAKAGKFSVAPMVMALLKTNLQNGNSTVSYLSANGQNQKYELKSLMDRVASKSTFG